MNPREDVLVRAERTADRRAVRTVHEIAFGRGDEAALVENLHIEGAVIVSLVAELNSRVAGHILFSRCWIDTASGPVAEAALAPVAVLPEVQRRGIGHALIRRGLDQLRDLGESAVIVLGHPDYYPRFGFSKDKTKLIESPFPAEVFMGLEIESGALNGIKGRIRYANAFGL